MWIEVPPWGIFIASYLFLGGVSGGAFALAAVLEILGRHKTLGRWAGFVSAPAIVVGLMLLLLDLGRPERAYLVFANIRTSVMTWGSIIISVFAALTVGYSSFSIRLFPWSGWTRLRKMTAAVGLVFAVATLIYTGVLLAVAPGRPLWNSVLIPALFSIGGLSTGIAMSLTGPVFASLKRIKDQQEPERQETLKIVHSIHRIDVYVVGLEILVIVSLLSLMLISSSTSAGVATMIVAGPLSGLFWVGVVVVGLAIPLVGYVYGSRMSKRGNTRSLLLSVLAAAFAALFGGLVLRYIIVTAGWSIPLLPNPGDFIEIPPPLVETTPIDYALTAGLLITLAVAYYVGAKIFLPGAAAQKKA